MIEAKTLRDSVGEHSPRLHTQFWRYPKFVHQESLRHRKLSIEDALANLDFSFSVSSARAIPVWKNLEEVRSDELRASPVLWGAEQKGMSPVAGELSSEEMRVYEFVEAHGTLIGKAKTPLEHAGLVWKRAALEAADTAELMSKIGVHKSIVNRIVEPFLHVNCVVTGTEPGWMNWFGLRLDGAADPTLRALAEATWRSWGESKPRKLKPGQWHLPFIDDDDLDAIDLDSFHEFELQKKVRKSSAARCARTSYLSFETGKRSTITEDLRLFDKLVGARPMHLSPLEHQATPDYQAIPDDDGSVDYEGWAHPEEAGNLGPGWRQFRKMIPGEAVAPLPEGYAT